MSINPISVQLISGFNPTQISGCTLWLDGADTSTMTLSGTTITQWRDKSGKGYNQVGYNSPQYSSSTKGITLNGTNNYFASATSGGSLQIPTATHCLIAVHSPTTISGSYTGNTSLFRFQGLVATASTYIVFPYMEATTRRGYINSQDGTATQYNTSGLVENSVANTQNLIVANIAANSQLIYKNGSLQSSATASLTNTTSDFFALGCQNWGYINGQQYEFYSGTVYELMVFTTTITTAQQQQVEGYLAWKWGLQANLPSTHPYKNTSLPQFSPLPPFPQVVVPTSITLAPIFLPTSIPGCKLWLDGADPAGTGVAPANGSTVSTWVDKSSTGNTMTVTSGTLTYTTNPKSVSFPNTQVTCTSALSTNVITAGSSCIFIVVQDTYINATTFGMAFTCVNIFTGGIYPIALRFQDATTKLRVSATDDIGSNYYVNGTLGSPVGSLITVPNGYNIIDGTFILGGTTQFALSAVGTLISRYFTGNIQEVVVYSGPITTAQQQQVQGYLAWKWGLVANLPSNHPYKSINPSPYYNQALLYTNKVIAISFNPRSIAGCALWLDGADPNATGVLPTNGDSVSLWKDKSGTGNNMSLTSGTAIYNASPKAVNFPNGGNGVMTSVNSTSVTANQSVVFVVSEPTVLSPGGIDYVFVCRNIFTGDYSIRFPSLTSIFATNAGDLGYDIGNGGAYYVNGTLGVPSGSPNKTITVPSGINIIYGLFSTSGTTAFGISYSTFSRYFIGNVQEIIVYTGPITTVQRQQVEGYLAWKWGIQANLPLTQPYKLFPPPPS